MSMGDDMIDLDTLRYHIKREADERERASVATHPNAAASHLQLAQQHALQAASTWMMKPKKDLG